MRADLNANGNTESPVSVVEDLIKIEELEPRLAPGAFGLVAFGTDTGYGFLEGTKTGNG